ncbi:MAG: tyrosine-type recombinase/integrase [Methanothrix sp.]
MGKAGLSVHPDFLEFLSPGCRLGELVTTRVSDINFHNGFIRIQSSRTKTRHFRAARVSQDTLQAIQESLQPDQEWLFPGRSSGHLSTKTILQTIDRLAEEAGVQEVSPRQKRYLAVIKRNQMR